jgi:DNA (cytosine-5)-methyltransferase 1
MKGQLNELALFAGAGGGILGGHLLGWRTVCAVEWEPYPASVLCARQNDGLLPPFPIWDDVQTFDGKPWRGLVDVVSGGFPCQDISAAGKGDGLDGARSGMWTHMARVVGEVRPRYVFVENSPMLVTRGLERVLGDLASFGYDTKWTVMGAADVGANHQRDRIWIVANSRSQRSKARTSDSQRGEKGEPTISNNGGNDLANSELSGSKWWSQQQNSSREKGRGSGIANWWKAEPNVGRVANGVAARVDRLKAIGNGQVPLCAAEAWRLLTS